MKKIVVFSSLFLLFLTSFSLSPKSVQAVENSSAPKPPANVSAVAGPKAGEVTLYWNESAYADRYAVAFGEISNNYKYGAENIGDASSRTYTVKGLRPGVRYFFRLAAAKGDNSSGFSSEVSVVARHGSFQMEEQENNMKDVQTSYKAQVTKADMKSSKLMAVTGASVGQANLTWARIDQADDYHLMYGTGSRDYRYGALNIGNVNSFTVGSLKPGVRYYFVLIPLENGKALSRTNEASAVSFAGMHAEKVETTAEALMMPVEKDYQKAFDQMGQNPPEVIASPVPGY